MQFDFAAFRQHIWALASPHLPTVATAAGGTLVILLALGAVWAFWPEPEITEDAVALAGPTFTPAIITAPAPSPAAKAASSGEGGSTRYDDLRREDDRSLARAVQRELKRAGCYDGPINGAWSPSTRRAMAEFTGLVNARLPVDHPDPILLVLLETHDKVSCGAGAAGAAPPARKGEVASIADEAPPAPARASASVDQPSDSAQDAPRRATLAEPESETQAPSSASVAAAAGGAAALTTAAVASSGEKSALDEPGATEPKRTTRKYRKPSLSRQVSKGFKSIQRSLQKFLW